MIGSGGSHSIPSASAAAASRNALTAGLCVHEIEPTKLISPEDGPMSGYFYRHADPVIPTYWLSDEVAPSIERVIARYQGVGRRGAAVRADGVAQRRAWVLRGRVVGSTAGTATKLPSLRLLTIAASEDAVSAISCLQKHAPYLGFRVLAHRVRAARRAISRHSLGR
jgi:hypothetical protein